MKKSVMHRLKKILAPTDLSKLSLTGVRYALETAKARQTEVIVYNVIMHEETPFPAAQDEWLAGVEDHPRLKQTIEERKILLAKFLEENFAALLPKVKIRAEVKIGIPHKCIVEKALEEDVDVIVMCTHGRTGLLHALIGSVTEKVVRRAGCPVLSIPPPNEKRAAEKAA